MFVRPIPGCPPPIDTPIYATLVYAARLQCVHGQGRRRAVKWLRLRESSNGRAVPRGIADALAYSVNRTEIATTRSSRTWKRTEKSGSDFSGKYSNTDTAVKFPS